MNHKRDLRARLESNSRGNEALTSRLSFSEGRRYWSLVTSAATRFAAAAAITFSCQALALEIKLPSETGAFKQDAGAEIANGQCLICHSVEYVTVQPPFGRAFWKASVQKMQQKYGAPIADAQIEPLVDYLTKNYGIMTNGATASAPVAAQTPNVSSATSDGPQIAMKYGCLVCHNTKVKILGPAYKDIATKYKTDPEAAAKIGQQIQKGGSGKWGPMIMPPFPQVSVTETKVLSDWILGLK
jgi:sulfite dehydrogenase